MKTEEQLYQRESARPRVVLRANSQCELQDLPRKEARSSCETQSDARASRKPDTTLWTREFQAYHSQQFNNEQRQHVVAKLIEMFESHQHKEKLLQDIDQTEIFELCENSTKLPCFDCNSFTEIGTTYCSCGRNLKTSRGVPQHFKRATTISIRSLATSLRRILVEDQSTANLRNKLCSSRRTTCSEKQRTKRTEIIRRFSPDGQHKKGTRLRQRSTILAKKKSCFTTKLLWRTTTTQPRKLNEFKIQSIWVLSINT